MLADDGQAEVVEEAERGQVRSSEGTVKHVEDFRMVSVGTSTIERPRPRSRDRHATRVVSGPLRPQMRRAIIFSDQLWNSDIRAAMRRGRYSRPKGPRRYHSLRMKNH